MVKIINLIENSPYDNPVIKLDCLEEIKKLDCLFLENKI